jgi:hypothetical protein
MNDLDLARQRQRERVLEEAALDREAWAWYREGFDHQQESGLPRDDPPGRAVFDPGRSSSLLDYQDGSSMRPGAGEQPEWPS